MNVSAAENRHVDNSNDLDAAGSFRSLPATGVIETDRFCAGCGFNLRQQPVRRDTRTKLLLAQCPECGGGDPAVRETSAARLWTAWLVRLFLVFWVGAVLGLTGLCGLAMYGLTFEFARLGFRFWWTDGGYQVAVRNAGQHDELVMTLLLGGVGIAGWCLVSLLTVLLPHWRKVGYPAVLLAAGVLVFVGVLAENWDRFTTGILWESLWQRCLVAVSVGMIGGLAAVWLARPAVRLMVRVLVPPRMRPPLAYLWLVDGKEMPRAGSGKPDPIR